MPRPHSWDQTNAAGPKQGFCLSDNKLFDPGADPVTDTKRVSSPLAHGCHPQTSGGKPGLIWEATSQAGRTHGPRCVAWLSWLPAQEGGTSRGSG